VNIQYIPVILVRGSSGGGRSSSSGRSSSGTSKSGGSTSTSKSSRPTTSTKTTTTGPKPSSKTTNGKSYSGQGNVVGGDYAPRFGGYSPPAGSVVYYRDTSFTDYLPWIYLFSRDNQQQPQAVVMQPDGKQHAVKADTDTGMVVFEWVMLIALVALIIGGLVFVAKKSMDRHTL
jgi:cobalamin biosynthesis Mg chelatase CobN